MCLHAEAQGRLTFEDLKVENSSCAIDPVLLHAVQHDIEFGVVPLYDPAFAEPSHDSRTFIKRAEHDRCSAILVQVAVRIDAVACVIHVVDIIAF